jgi:hypothetical protein
MSIIYSYPTSQPTVDDLLIGTDVNDDNATKSFTVQSLVSLINAAAGSGTVTYVGIATDYSLSATGGPIRDEGTITMKLNTTGVPDTTTFLGYSAAGQLEWRLPTVTSGIIVSNNSSIIAGSPTTGDPLASLNFTGEGVDATSDSLGNVQVSIPGAQNAIEKIVPGAGITVSSPTGNVTISNSGILSISQGDGITATTTEGVTTISATSSASGTVTSVTPGPGLRLDSDSTSTASPIIGINYGNAPGNLTSNYINQQDGFIVDDDSIIPHYTQRGGNKLVYQTRLGDIPLTALTNINTAITDSAANVVKNDTDVSPFLEAIPRVDKVVTLTDAQYQTLITSSPLPTDFANTLYLTTAAGATPEPQYQVFNSISDTISNPLGAAYTVTSTVANGASRTRAAGTTENWSTSVSVNDPSSFQFTVGPTISPASPQSVTYDADKTISTSISGTIAAVTVAQCTSFLGGQNGNTGAGIGATVSGQLAQGLTLGTDYSVTYGNTNNSVSGACTSTFTPSQSFPVTYALIGPGDTGYIAGRGSDKYTLTSGPNNSYSGVTTFGSDATCNISGTLIFREYPLSLTLINNIDGNGGLMGTNYDLNNGPDVFTLNNTLVQSTTRQYGSGTGAGYNIGTTVNARATFALSNISLTPSGPDVGLWDNASNRFLIPADPGVNKDYDFTITLTGSSGASSVLVTAGTQTVNVGLNGDYAFQYNLNGANAWTEYTAPFSVPAGTVVAFAYTVLPANGYFFLNAPVLSYNGSVVANGTNTGLLRTIFDSFTATADTTRGPVSVTATTNANFPSTLVSFGGQLGTQCTALRTNKVYLKKGAGNNDPLVIQQNDFLYTNTDSANPIPIDYYSGYGPEEVEFAVDNQGKVGALSTCGPLV